MIPKSFRWCLSALVLAPLLAFVPAPVGAEPSAVAPTAGATVVTKFGATPDDSSDDTAGFVSAMSAALSDTQVRYQDGPGGAPQAVAYVPPGTYRILNLQFPSNVRLEVAAGAVLAQAGGRYATAPKGATSPAPSMILWDGPISQPVRNVSVVGVGESTGGRKAAADPVSSGWSVANSFTFDLDSAVTGGSNLASAIMAVNVDGFEVARVVSFQNDTQPTGTGNTPADWYPGTQKAALVMRARRDTPVGGPYYDPHNGRVSDWYNVGATRGYGPTQVTSGHALSFRRLYSEGGTTLRLETDNSNQTTFGSEVRDVSAAGVTGERCNRAVAFAPHAQNNYSVDVTNVRATGCYQGVVESVDTGIASDRRGSFTDSTIADVVVVAGDGAQIPVSGYTGRWTVGSSFQSFSRDKIDPWAVVYATDSYSCSGKFARISDAIRTPTGDVVPSCYVDPGPLLAPTNLTATAVSRTKIRLKWTRAANVSGYEIARSQTSGGPYTAVVTTTDASYADVQLRRATTYYYVVRSLRGDDRSADSAPASATTQP